MRKGLAERLLIIVGKIPVKKRVHYPDPFFQSSITYNMTINDIYAKLYSRSYYDKLGQHKIKFINNCLFVDRRADVSFSIYTKDGIFYLQTLEKIADESLFRLEINEEEIILYVQQTNDPLWILE